MELSQIIKKTSEAEKNQVALSYHDAQMSYQALDSASDLLANAWIEQGLRKGDRIALFMFNSLEMVISYFAIFKMGAVAVPVNNRFKSSELHYVLEHCAATLLVIDESLLPIYTELKSLFNIPCILSSALMLQASNSTPKPSVHIEPHDLACVLYTSGTTSKPKGVMHSHSSLFNTAINQSHSLHMSPEDKVLVCLSICHIAGFSGQLLTTLYIGGQLVLIKQFDPEILLTLIEQCGITHLMLLPTQLELLVSHPKAKQSNLSSLKLCVVGGDKVPLATHTLFHQLTGQYACECCGMTESFSYAINFSRQKAHLGSIGIPTYATELNIIDEDQNTLPSGQTGEIVVKSLANMLGYWNNAEATEATLKKGWVYTGDLAYQDKEGYYWFAGRKKDIIIRGGSNISPLEVEELIYKHPAVKEVGVFAYPDKHFGEVVHARVVLKEGQSLTEDDLKKFIKTALSDYKVPEKIFFVSSIPHNAIGKLDRKKLCP